MRVMNFLLIALATSINSYAATPQEVMSSYAAQAKQQTPGFKEFSAARGEQFYHAKRTHSTGKQISCAACHTDNPKNPGIHEKTRKEILPLAPASNKVRFTDTAKVEKWFKRNCADVVERACTDQEKGDFIAYLLSVK